MIPARSSSLALTTSASEKLRTLVLLPAGVSPFPSAPWHVAHFALYVAALLSSALVLAKSRAGTAAIIARQIIFDIDLVFIVQFPPKLESRVLQNAYLRERVTKFA